MTAPHDDTEPARVPTVSTASAAQPSHTTSDTSTADDGAVSGREFRDVVAERLEQMAAGPLSVTAVGSTAVLYADDWTRDLVLDEIIEEYLARQPSVRNTRRMVVVMSGPPGAGKTRLREHLAADDDVDVDSGFRVIDADIVKDLLLGRGLADGIFDSYLTWPLPDRRPLMLRELAGLVHVESVRIADDLRRICLDRGEDLVIDGTLRWDGMSRILFNDLDDHHYRDLHIVSAEVDLDRAAQQALQRWWDVRDAGIDPWGGRFTPRTAIADCYPNTGSGYGSETSPASDGTVGNAGYDAIHSVCWTHAQHLYELAARDGAFDSVRISQLEGDYLRRQSYRRT